MDLEEYEKKVEEEKKIFNPNLYNENLTEIAGSGLTYLLDKFQERVRKQIGKNIWDYTVDAVNNVSNDNEEVKIEFGVAFHPPEQATGVAQSEFVAIGYR